MRISPRLNKYERREMHAEKLKNNMAGTGVYVYENNTDGDLKLPKPTDSGIKMVGPRRQFQGDSYYMQWVGSPMNLLKLVKEVVPKMSFQEIQDNNEKQRLLGESTMNEKQLILDQPDCVTNNGTIERVVVDPAQAQINDNTKQPTEVLLTEDPLDGVEIILN